MTESSNSKNSIKPNSSWVEMAQKCHKPEKICPCCLRQIFYCWPKSLLQVDNSDLHETIDLTAALRLDKKDRLRPVTKVTQCSDHKEDHTASPGGVSSALSKLSREVELLIPKIPPRYGQDTNSILLCFLLWKQSLICLKGKSMNDPLLEKNIVLF